MRYFTSEVIAVIAVSIASAIAYVKVVCS